MIVVSHQGQMNQTTILIAENHPVVVEGLRRMLDRPEFEIVGAVGDGRTLVQVASRLQPDLIITALALPSQNGIDAVRDIFAANQKPKIIFFTMHAEVAYAAAALAAGAYGYVLKNAAPEELIDAIRAALKGNTYVSKAIALFAAHAPEIRSASNRSATDLITRRQREVLELLAGGRQVKEIAAVLNLSPKTVEFHKYRTMQLFGARTVAELTCYAVRRGIIT